MLNFNFVTMALFSINFYAFLFRYYVVDLSLVFPTISNESLCIRVTALSSCVLGNV